MSEAKAPYCEHPKPAHNAFLCEACSSAWYGPVEERIRINAIAKASKPKPQK